MIAFLIFADAIFLIFAALFLFFPKVVVTLSKLANEVLVYTDEKIYAGRKIAGVICLILGAFLAVVILRLYHII